MQLVKKALEGQDRAIQTILKLSDEFEAALKAATEAQAATLSSEAMDEVDRAVLAEFRQHLLDEELGLAFPERGPEEDPSDEEESGDGT